MMKPRTRKKCTQNTDDASATLEDVRRMKSAWSFLSFNVFNPSPVAWMGSTAARGEC